MNFIFIDSSLIWTPRIFLADSHHHSDMGSCEDTRCKITSDSQVECLFGCHQKLDCDLDIDDWPYDSQICFMDLAPLKSALQEFDFATIEEEESSKRIKEKETKTWSLLYFKMNDNQKAKRILFYFNRKSDMEFLNIILPGYFLIAFTFILPMMPIDLPMRTILSALNIFLHFNLIDRVWWQIPEGFEHCKFSQLMTVKLILSFVVLAESILLRRFLKSETAKKNSNILGQFREATIIKLITYDPMEVSIDKVESGEHAIELITRLIDRLFLFFISLMYSIAYFQINY